MKVNLEWDDKHVFPSVIHPDLAFLFQRMNEVSVEEVEASEGEELLDVGCGRAIDAIQLAKKGGKCLGLEPSRTMISHAKERIAKDGIEVTLIQGIGEYLPFKDCSFNKVMCKGAIDHFTNPSKAVEEMARVLKPQGKAIIVVANFESLSFRLGRCLFSIGRILPWGRSADRKIWQVPADHVYKFDYAFLRHLVEPRFKVEQSTGISFFFGLPWWGGLLAKLPKSVSLAILKSLDKLARHFPSLSDAILIKCSPRSEIEGKC